MNVVDNTKDKLYLLRKELLDNESSFLHHSHFEELQLVSMAIYCFPFDYFHMYVSCNSLTYLTLLKLNTSNCCMRSLIALIRIRVDLLPGM